MTARKSAKKGAARKVAKKTTSKAGGKKTTAKKTSSKAAPKKSASKKASTAKKAEKKKPASKPKAAKPPKVAPAPPKPTAPKSEAPARESGGPISSLDVNLGHIFSLRPRVSTSFPQNDLRRARELLQDDGFKTLEEAARAVAEKALDLSHGIAHKPFHKRR